MSVGKSRYRVRYDKAFKTQTSFKAGEFHVLKPDGTGWYKVGQSNCTPATPNSQFKSCRDEIHVGPPWIDGGPLTIIDIRFPPEQVLGSGVYRSDPVTRTYSGITGPVRYTGGFHTPDFTGDPVSYSNIPQLLNGVNPALIPSLTGWSPTAFSKTRPQLEKASLAVAIGESRDIPRMLGQTSRGFNDIWNLLGGSKASPFMQPKKAADQFLNHQFGWVPFINDLRRFDAVYQNAAAFKSRITNENNRWITRRATLLDSYQETLLGSGNGMRVSPAGDIVQVLFRDGASPTWTVKEEKFSLITTSGSFKYYRPEFDPDLPDYSSAWNAIQRQLTMYGARITPSNIYRATPWTWLIDWFSDFGSVVDRITDWAWDSILCKYLYLMRTDYRRVTLTQVLPFRTGDVVLSFQRETNAKIRRGSDSPYGFGLSWNNLSSRQLAILAALGVSRKSSNFP